MLSQEIQSALSLQLARELDSAYLYFSMSCWCHEKELGGFAGWLYKQYEEELSHASKIFYYLVRNEAAVKIPPLSILNGEWETPVDLFEDVYEHEKYITKSIYGVYSMAEDTDDFPTCEFLDWFVREQVQEEKSALEVLGRVRMTRVDSPELRVLDQQLGERE